MISIVIPIYNEESNITTLYDRLIAASPKWNTPFELILVDDGSGDDSFKLLVELAKKDDRVKVIKLSRNFGHQAAITSGIKYAKGDAVVIMDGDLQDPPEQLNIFLDKWKEGYDVVYAVRTKRKEGFIKKMAYKLFYRLLKFVSDINIPLDSGDFCVMDKKIVKVLNTDIKEQNRFVRGLRAFAGFKQIGVKYERDARLSGEPKYTFSKLLKLAIDGLLDFSTFPLRIAVYFGIFLAVPSFLLSLFFVVHRIFNFKLFGYSPTDTPGLATLAVGMFFFLGIILIILGIIGEYIGRIYFEVKQRPFYIVEEVVGEKHNL